MKFKKKPVKKIIPKFKVGDITIEKYPGTAEYISDKIISINLVTSRYHVMCLRTKDGTEVGDVFHELINDYDLSYKLSPETIWNNELKEIIDVL